MAGRNLLRRVLWDQRRDVALGSLLVMLHQAAEAVVPVTIGAVVDRAIRPADGAALVRWLAGLAVLFVGLSAAGCTGSYVYERVIVRSGHAARLLVVRRVLDARGMGDGSGAAAAAGPTPALAPGELVSLASIDTTRVGEGVGAVVLGAGAVVGTVGAAVALMATSVRLGLVVLVGLPVVLVLVRLLSRPLEHRSAAEQEAVAAASGVATDLMAGLRVLKGLGAEAAAAVRYRRSSQAALRGALRTARVEAAYEGLTLTASGAFLVVVAWVGGRLALDGTISVGELVAALGLTQFLAGPLTRVAYVAATLAEAQGSAHRIDAVLRTPPAVTDGQSRFTEPVQGALSLRDLAVMTAQPPAVDPPDDPEVHRPPVAEPPGDAGLSGAAVSEVGQGGVRAPGIDLDVAPGELIGLVVVDPVTATALLDHLDRTLDPAQGEITLDGMPLTALAVDECRRALLVARHDADLFEGTLADNVAASVVHPNGHHASRYRGPDALVAAAADEVAEALPGGVDAAVGEGGRALSGGQRQRVALARALAADPPVLVLHDPTTAVDAVTEHRIAQGLRRLRAGRTTVMLTTSPPLLAAADRVVLIDEGRVAAEGTHADLAASDARYREAVLS